MLNVHCFEKEDEFWPRADQLYDSSTVCKFKSVVCAGLACRVKCQLCFQYILCTPLEMMNFLSLNILIFS